MFCVERATGCREGVPQQASGPVHHVLDQIIDFFHLRFTQRDVVHLTTAGGRQTESGDRDVVGHVRRVEDNSRMC